MKLQSISNLQELIKNLKVKKFGKRTQGVTEAGNGNGAGGKKDRNMDVIKDAGKHEDITQDTEKKKGCCENIIHDTCDEGATR